MAGADWTHRFPDAVKSLNLYFTRHRDAVTSFSQHAKSMNWYVPAMSGFSSLALTTAAASPSTLASEKEKAPLTGSLIARSGGVGGVGGSYAQGYNHLPGATGSKTISTSNEAIPLPLEPQGDRALTNAGLTPEYVVVDCRLEYPSLLRFDSSVEVFMLEGSDGESDLCVAFPVGTGTQPVFSESWRRSDGGWMWVPRLKLWTPDRLSDGVIMANDWFAGLRYHIDASIRKNWTFLGFSTGTMRLFLLPLPSESCTRVLAVTNTPVMNNIVRQHPQSKVSRILSHYMLTPMTGEWRQTFSDDREDALTTLLFSSTSSTSSTVTSSSATTSSSSSTSPTTSSVMSMAAPLIAPLDLDSEEEMLDGLLDDVKDLLDHPISARARLRSSGAYFDPAPALPDASDEAPSSSSSSSSSTAGVLTLTDDMTTLPLFPHQRRTVAWIHKREQEEPQVFHFPQVRRFLNHYGYMHGWEQTQLLKTIEILHAALPRGGCVAHSVGAGKTVISAGLLAQTHALDPSSPQYGATLIIVPNHILIQWERELRRFAPQLTIFRVPFGLPLKGGEVVLSSFQDLQDSFPLLASAAWTRLIIDEPHDLEHEVTGIRARFRWALTATPEPLCNVMQAVWGEEIAHPFDQVLRAPFIRHCARRDPPGECLPVPPLTVQMIPVTLTWQESSVVQMESMNGQVINSVRTCSYFSHELASEAGSAPQENETPVPSLDQWVNGFRAKYNLELRRIADQMASTERVVTAQMAQSAGAREIVQAKQTAKRDALLAALAVERQNAHDELILRYPQSQELLANVEVMTASLIVVKPAASRQHSSPEEEEIRSLMMIWVKYFKPRDEPQGPTSSSSSSSSSSSRSKKNSGKKQKGPVKGPASPDWEPTNDLEVRIVYLAALLQLRRHFISREHTILDQTSALSAEDIFDAGDMSGVDSTLLNRLAELTTQRTNLEKTLNFLQNVEDTLRNPETECAICYEPLQGSETSLFKCLHAFCSPCVVGTFRQATEATCPMCRVKSLKRDVCTFKCVIGSPEEPSSSEPEPAAEPTPPVKFYGSKIDVLIASIQKIIATSDDKIVVFGQWAALIISVHEALTVRGLDNQALSDLMETRCDQLDRFRHDPNARVLLLSSENQSSGINLDCANHVFILHPRVVPGTIMPLLESQAFEKQAVGRVHRYPQSKPVFVYRLYARGSVEEELYALCGYFN